MSHLSNELLQQCKEKLLERRSKLVAVAKEADEENPVNEGRTVEASPDASASEELKILESEAVGSEVSETLARIDAALQRIENGTYGHTSDGKDIPVQRLLVDPTATTLVQ